MRRLVLLSVPEDADHDPVGQWLLRLPELEGAEVVWTGPDKDDPTDDEPGDDNPWESAYAGGPYSAGRNL